MTNDELQAEIEDLKAQQAQQTQALRHIIEGRLDGPLPNAAADVVALEGGQTTITVNLGKDSGA